jgi:hypothetical protein
MNKYRSKVAKALVWLANWLVKYGDTPSVWPLYRPVDSAAPGEKWACGAYSLEGLRSLVEQDGPDGFGARATVKWLIGDEGWRSVADMDLTELRRTLAMSGIDMDDQETQSHE